MQKIPQTQLQIMQRKKPRKTKSSNSYGQLKLEDEFRVNIYSFTAHV